MFSAIKCPCAVLCLPKIQENSLPLEYVYLFFIIIIYIHLHATHNTLFFETDNEKKRMKKSQAKITWKVGDLKVKSAGWTGF